jgi:peptidoglycan hydrolase CwlO-like protein
MKCLSKKPEDRFKNGKELHNFVIERTAQEYNKPSQEIASLQKEVAFLEQSKKLSEDKLQAELTQAQERSSSLKQEINTLSQEVDRLRKNGGTTHAKPKKAWKFFAILFAITTCFLFFLYSDSVNNHIDPTEFEGLQIQLIETTNRKNELERIVTEKTETITKLEKQQEETTATINDLNAQIQSLSTQINKLKTTINDQKQTIANYKKEIEVLKKWI